MICKGDWVFFPARLRVNQPGVGQVLSVSGDGVNPCKCCGLGVTVQRPETPNVRLAFRPSDLLKLDRAPARRRPCNR